MPVVSTNPVGPLAGFYDEELFDTNGNVLQSASVLVKNLDGTNAKLYTSASMATEAPNPAQADSLGNLRFWAPNGTYNITVTPQGGTAQAPYQVVTSLAPGQAQRIDDFQTYRATIPADYVLARDGTLYRMFNGFTQAEVGNGSEPGALMQTAINALGTQGGSIALGGRGDFDWGSVPKFPAGLTRRLTIDSTGPVVNLSTNGPRFLDPGSVDPNLGAPPPGSTFRNLTLNRIALDAMAIKDDTRGHHLLFGNARAGALYSQINFAGIRVLGCKVLNGRTAGGGSDGQNALYFATMHSAAGQSQNFVRDVLVHDLEVTGCLQFMSCVGFKSGTWTGDPDIWMDAITVQNWRHDRGVVPAGFVLGGVHVHIGARARVGRVVVENGYGFGSQDIGVEINNFQDALIRNIEVEEHNGFAIYLHNFLPPVRIRNQVGRIENISGRHLAARNAVVANDASSLVCTVADAGLPLGDVSVKGVNYYRDIPRMAGMNGIGVRIEGEHRSVSAENVSVEVEGLNHTSTTEQAYPKLIAINPANMTPVKLRNVQARATGTVAAGAAAHGGYGLLITGSLDLDAENVRAGLDIVGAADFSLRGIQIGSGGMATTIKGMIRRFKVLTMSATRPSAMSITSTSTTTIPTQLVVADSDFSASVTGSQDVSVGAGNEHLVHRRPGSVWRVPPAPVGITVGTSPFTYRNVSGFRQRVIVRGGTVSEVAWSRDNATFAIVNTTTGVVIEVENGEYVRVTYSAVPVMTAIPVV